MLRNIGILLLIAVLSIMFIQPLRDYMNNLFKNKAQLNEEYTIGTVAGYNPRVREAQEILRDAGLYSGVVDGVIGAQTRLAIKEIQKKIGLKAHGRIDAVTLLALQRLKELPKPNEAKVQESSLPEPAEKVEPQAQDKEAAPAAKISKPVKSEIGTEQIQKALQTAGFYKGKIDGKLGPQTKKAIKAFQKSQGLKADGIAGQKTREALSKYLTGP